jgi:hypothetical protein
LTFGQGVDLTQALNARPAGRVFNLVLIKPTHYDDDGYPIQWFRSAIPSNTLACINGLAEDAARRQALGPDVEIRIHAFDETNTRVRPAKIIETVRQAGGLGMICLVGVQSNQFPRAVDLAKKFREAGLQVGIGGFHVSGCVSMLAELPAEIVEAQKLGISLFAGESENGRFAGVLRDALENKLQPLYNFLNDLPHLGGEPLPILPKTRVRRTIGTFSSLDFGRGCPYQCSFCTIINVQGRKSRFRTPDDLESILRENYAQGIKRFFITDDNFARNHEWESLFDRIIKLREEEGMVMGFTIQVDTLCHKIPNFIEKATRAGAGRVFIGLENINPDNLIGANKRQNKITEYRAMLQKWRDHGALTAAGYILGFPGDTKESILRDVEIIKRELPLDLLEFFYLTPLPGSEDHRQALARGDWMDPDFNKYDLNHRVTHHPKMSDAEWEEAYHAAWASYYSPEHVRTIFRRAAVNRLRFLPSILSTVLWFRLVHELEGLHPLEGGAIRMKYRLDRRPGLPIESALTFYPRIAVEHARKLASYAKTILEFRKIAKEAREAPDRATYMDPAITPQVAEEFAEMALYHATSGGENALARKKRDETIRKQKAATASV